VPKNGWFLKRKNANLHTMCVDKNYLPALTGVRALAAFWVLLYHLHPALRAYFGDVPFISPVIYMGYQGVDLFFVLSGFVIAHQYADRLRNFSWQKYRDYLWARVARIYPLHLFMLLCVLGLVKLAPFFGFTINRGTDYLWFDFVRNLFLVQSWQFPAYVNWNHFAWSISAEWFAYLLAPLFVLLIWAPKRLWILVLLGVLFLLISPLAVVFLSDARPSAYALFRITGAFGAGMIANRFWREKKIMINEFLIFALLFFSAGVQYRFISGTDFLTVPFSTLFIYVLAEHRGSISKLLSTKFFSYCGRISFSLYITQFVVLMPIKKILPFEKLIGHSHVVQISYLIGICMLTFLTAIAGYHLIEEPAREYLRNKKGP
jgi:peptidoglycan/LPS O-acetylase OafA/YrhL